MQFWGLLALKNLAIRLFSAFFVFRSLPRALTVCWAPSVYHLLTSVSRYFKDAESMKLNFASNLVMFLDGLLYQMLEEQN